MKIPYTESIQVTVTHKGCFHFDSATIELSLEEDLARCSATKDSGGELKTIRDNATISHNEFRSLVDNYIKVWSTNPKLSGDRSTTVYDCSILWIVGTSSTRLIFESSELPAKVVEDILKNNDMDKSDKCEIAKSREGYYNPAHEIYYLTQDLIAKFAD